MECVWQVYSLLMKRLQAAPVEGIRLDLDIAVLASAGKVVHRLHALLLVSLGRSCYEVAALLREHPCTVERWMNRYQECGLEGLREHPRGGRPSSLTSAQLRQLQAELLESPIKSHHRQSRWSGKLVALHLHRDYGLSYSVRHCQRLLTQAGLNAASFLAFSAPPGRDLETRRDRL